MLSHLIHQTLKKIGIKATPGYSKTDYPAVFYSPMDGTIDTITKQQFEIRILDKNYDKIEELQQKIIDAFHVQKNNPSKLFSNLVWRCKVTQGGIYWNEKEYDCTIYLAFSYHKT